MVLDTDVASKLQRGNLPGELNVHLVGKRLCITFVTVGEFYKGATKRKWGARRLAELEGWMRKVLVLPYNANVSQRWGEIQAKSEEIGRKVPDNDAWIAACCLAHGLSLVTLNRKHFDLIEGITLVP